MTSSVVRQRRSSKALPKSQTCTKKFMVTIWYSAAGLIYYSLLNPGETITSEKYAQQVDQFSGSVVSDSLWPHGPQQARPPCPSPTPRACSNLHPSSQWCHQTTTSSIIPFFSCLQSFLASGCFQMDQFFTSGGQSIGVSASASVLPMNIQDWFPLGWTRLISLLSKGLSRVFSNTTVRKHQFIGTQLSLWPNCHIYTWLLVKL